MDECGSFGDALAHGEVSFLGRKSFSDLFSVTLARSARNAPASRGTLANVQVATGITRCDTQARLMRAFSTPFFPDILFCWEIMGEGVDLQRSCRHIIHHDLAWNPSTIEQRIGRIDRLGCKAEGPHSIVVMRPDEAARLITPDSTTAILLPSAISDALSYNLSLEFLGN